MSFYLDASVIVPLHVEEASSGRLDPWLKGLDAPVLVSDLAAGEFSAAVSRLVRMRLLPSEDAAMLLLDFDVWRQRLAEFVKIEPRDIGVAAQFVRHPLPKLLMPDAIHLAVCQRLGLTLVTLDGGMADAAAIRGIALKIPA